MEVKMSALIEAVRLMTTIIVGVVFVLSFYFNN